MRAVGRIQPRQRLHEERLHVRRDLDDADGLLQLGDEQPQQVVLHGEKGFEGHG